MVVAEQWISILKNKDQRVHLIEGQASMYFDETRPNDRNNGSVLFSGSVEMGLDLYGWLCFQGLRLDI